MPSVRLTGVEAIEQGFRVTIDTGRKLLAYRVTVVWTSDDWQSTRSTEARLANIPGKSDVWTADISYPEAGPTTVIYAISASGLDGVAWDNNGGQNHQYRA